MSERQVVTNENIQQLIETGKVDDFVPPKAEEPKAEARPEPKSDDKTEQARDASGKFVKAEADKVDDGADDDENLPEKVRKIIGKKHREMKEAEEFAEREYNERKAAERRAEKLEAELEAERQKSRPASETAKEPKPEDFKTVAEYADAVVEWKLEQKIRERDEKQARERFVAEQTKLDTEFAKRVETAKAEIPDYEEVLRKVDRNVPNHIWNYMRESDLGAHIGYHFAKHPEVLDRLETLSPIRALAELGKLEIALEKKEPESKDVRNLSQISKAPAPITPIEGNAAPVIKDLNREMSFAEYKAAKRAQEAAKRR